MKSSVKFPQSVMIWGAMSSAGVSPLCFLKTNVTAPVYQEILEHFMLPSADQLFKYADFIFQQDLAPARTAQRPLNQQRTRDGEFSLLVREMQSIDKEKHYQYFRMSALRFDDLVCRIAPYINLKKTHRSPVSTAESLAVTLRFLATGSSQQSIAASYRLGSRTVSKLIPEVCEAIWKSLQPKFVAVPSQADW